MTEQQRTERLSIRGDTFAATLEQVLDVVIRLATVIDQDRARSARFHSEASTLPELVRAAIETVTSLAAELGMAIVDVSVDGHRPVDGGHRCWGTVELTPPAVEQGVSIVDGPHVGRDPADGRWQIDLVLVPG